MGHRASGSVWFQPWHLPPPAEPRQTRARQVALQPLRLPGLAGRAAPGRLLEGGGEHPPGRRRRCGAAGGGAAEGGRRYGSLGRGADGQRPPGAEWRLGQVPLRCRVTLSCAHVIVSQSSSSVKICFAVRQDLFIYKLSRCSGHVSFSLSASTASS